MSTIPQRSDVRPSPGWYADPVQVPARRHERRYWDGTDWTASVADGDRVGHDPLPPPAEPDRRAALPARAALLVLLALVASQLFALAGALLAGRLAPGSLALRLLLSQAGLWTALVGACVLASRRWGTGRLRDDFGIRARGAGDAGRGLLVAVVVRVVATVVVAVLYVLAPELVGASSLFDDVSAERAAVVLLAVFAVVGAPLVEETFFRGLLLQSLRGRFGVPAAVTVQGLVFAVSHVNPELGRANLGPLIGLAVAGVALGVVAERYRRLGPSMWAHAFFNLLPVLLLVAFGGDLPVPSQPTTPGS